MSTIMEQPFYDDSFLSAYGHPGAAAAALLPSDYKQLLKQNMNLNFADSSYRNSNLKSQLRAAAGDFYPDAGSLKLASPELERLIIQNSTANGVQVLTTPTPHHHAALQAQQYLYSRGITDEQEGFADGFVKALDDLHKMNQMAPPNVSIGGTGSGGGGMQVSSGPAAGSVPHGLVFGSSSSSMTHGVEPLEYTTLGSCSSSSAGASYPSTTISYLPHQYHHHAPHHHQQPHHPQAMAHYHQHSSASSLSGAGLQGAAAQRFGVLMKEEPQTVPDMHSSDSQCSDMDGSPISPSMSPIDMENQERIKAERKRLRNRLAATKCRKRKLERISRLEDKVKILKTDNVGLSNTASVLRDQVAQLKQKVMTHVTSGCQLMLAPNVKSY